MQKKPTLPPLDIGYVVKKQFEWLYAAIIPGVMFVFGLATVIYAGASNTIEGFYYLFSFLMGSLLALFGLIWLIMVTIREIKTSYKKDRIKEHTKQYMQIKSLKLFYWAYAVASCLGLVVAIIMDNEQYLNTFVIIIVIIGLTLHYGGKRNNKS